MRWIRENYGFFILGLVAAVLVLSVLYAISYIRFFTLDPSSIGIKSFNSFWTIIGSLSGWAAAFTALGTLVFIGFQTKYFGNENKDKKLKDIKYSMLALRKLAYESSAILKLHVEVMNFISNENPYFNPRNFEKFYYFYSLSISAIDDKNGYEFEIPLHGRMLYEEYVRLCREYTKPYLRVFGYPNRDYLKAIFVEGKQIDPDFLKEMKEKFAPEFIKTNCEPFSADSDDTLYDLVKNTQSELERILEDDIQKMDDMILQLS